MTMMKEASEKPVLSRDNVMITISLSLLLLGVLFDVRFQFHPGFIVCYLSALGAISFSPSYKRTIILCAGSIFLVWVGWWVLKLREVERPPVQYRAMATFVLVLFTSLLSLQQRTRAALVRSLDGLTMAQELSGIGSWTFEPQTLKVSLSDRARFLLNTPNDICDLSQLLGLLSSEEQIRVRPMFMRDAFDLEVTVSAHNGQNRRLRCVGQIERDKEGKVEIGHGWFRDITELKAMEAKQRQLDLRIAERQRLDSLAQLSGHIAHDMNNMLLAISGNAELVALGSSLSDVQKDSLEKIHNITDRAAALSSQLLAVAGVGSLVTQRQHINEVIEEMSELLDLATLSRCSIDLSGLRLTKPIEMDSAQLQQVILNLVVNAIDAATKTQSAITLTCGDMWVYDEYFSSARFSSASAGEHVWFEVKDTGTGMVETTLEQIFNPMFTTKKDGHGLGMSAVLGIVKAHNGAIEIESSVSAGTTVRVWLPCYSGAEHSADLAGDLNSFSGEVLIVDDEEMIRGVLASLLSNLGFSPHTVGSASEALAFLSQCAGNLHAVILDVSMPEMDGIDCLNLIKRDWPNLPVLMMSGHWDQEVGGRVNQKDIAGFLQKPFKVEHLKKVFTSIAN
ncbi:MAG: signal transduction histidine kinase [Candidatus Azotimanducaceae bacterium]|jgi:signal transduction histidine kinase